MSGWENDWQMTNEKDLEGEGMDRSLLSFLKRAIALEALIRTNWLNHSDESERRWEGENTSIATTTTTTNTTTTTIPATAAAAK